MKILAVDDDANFRLLLDQVLSGRGHDVTLFNSADAAWEYFCAHGADIIVTDWQMPGMDGLELCRRVRARGLEDRKYVYLIVITVMDGRQNYLHAMDDGVDDFLNKPMDADQLLTRLRVAERILDMMMQLRLLESFLPICSYCRQIRRGEDEWCSAEAYLTEHSPRVLTHGICPRCYESQMRSFNEAEE
jgi:DNA-binding response OmpR family regulator